MRNFTSIRATAVGTAIALAMVLSAGCGNQMTLDSDRPTLSSTVIELGDYIVDASAQQGSSKWTFKVTRSGGPASNNLRFEWNFGDGGTYEGTSQSFTFTSPGLHRVSVRAFDRNGKLAFTLTLDVEITVVNAPPVADAGPDLTAIANGSVFLDGSASFDPDNDEITFLWTQIAGNPVNLLDADTPNPGFVAPLVDEDTRLVFKLEVSDEQSQSESTVVVDVEADLGLAGVSPECEFTIKVENQGDLGNQLEGLRPLTAHATASILGGNPNDSGTFTWTFDGVQEIGTIDTHRTISHSFSIGGIHAIALSLTIGGTTIDCVNTRNGRVEEYVTVWPTIEGRVEDSSGTPMGGVTVAANTGGTTAITDGSGLYKVHVPDRWTGELSAQHVGFAFSPSSSSFLGIDRDWTGQDFVGSESTSGGTPPNNGCTTAADCDDKLFCNGAETCVNTNCVSGSNPCNAGETCDETNAICTPLPTGCTVDSECEDGLFCNGAETCVAGSCVPAAYPCTASEACDEATNFCTPECTVDADCNGGSFCGGQETCVAGECQAGQGPNCDDGIACTVDSCNTTTDACEHSPNNASCSDGIFCNGAEQCDVALGCQPGSNPCGSLVCDENTDTCMTSGTETIYYVATNGSDSNDGSVGAPFATIKKATGLAVPGDTIYLRSGTYTEWDITFANSGAPGAPITFAAHPGEEGTVILQHGTGGLTARAMFAFNEASGQTPGFGHYIFKGLIIRNVGKGFWLGSTTARVHDLMLDGIEFYNLESAVKTEFMGVERIVIRNCISHDCASDAAAFNFKTNKATLEIPGSGSRNIIFLDNLVYNNPHRGSSGIIMQEQCEHSIIIGNTGYNIGQYPYTSKSGGYHIWLNNKAYNCGKGGFYLKSPLAVYASGETISGPPSNYILLNNVAIGRHVVDGGSIVKWWRGTNLYLYNNTLISLKKSTTGVANSPLSSDMNRIELPFNYITTGFSMNNILYHAGGFQVVFYSLSFNEVGVLPRRLEADHNIHYAIGKSESSVSYKIFARVVPGDTLLNLNLTFQGWKDWFVDNQSSTTDANTLWADPKLDGLDISVDSIWQDVRPSVGSPAIDAGQSHGNQPNDYPVKIEEFLAQWSFLNDFDAAVFPEKEALLNRIRTAHLTDIEGNPRGSAPDIGAYEVQ